MSLGETLFGIGAVTGIVVGIVGIVVLVFYVLYWAISTVLTYFTGNDPGFWVVLAIIIVIVIILGLISGPGSNE